MARLGDLCYKITDGSHNPPSGVPISEFLMLSSKNIHDGFITYDDPRYLSRENFEIENKRTQINPGDILMTIVGTVGRVTVVPENTNNICLQRSVAVIKPKKEIVLPRFLMYQIQSMKNVLEKEAKGVAQKGIYLKQVENLPIKVFERNVQESIVLHMDKICNLIELRNQQLSKLDKLVKARFTEMFGDPVINPKFWETTPLSSLIVTANNGMARRGKDIDGSIVLRLVELQNGFIDYTEPNRISLTETEEKRYRLKDNDFLFARVNGNPDYVGRCAVFKEIPEPVYHNDHIIRVHFDETKINGCFTSVLLNSDYGKRQMREQIKTSAGQYTISQDGIGAIMAILPPLELQKQFASFVEKIEKSKLEIQQSLEKLETLKKSLMQQYFG